MTFVPGHDVDLVDLDVTLQFYHRRFGDQAAAQLLRHGLHRPRCPVPAPGDLPAEEVQAYEVEAQHPHAQRLVVPGQHRAGQAVETS